MQAALWWFLVVVVLLCGGRVGAGGSDVDVLAPPYDQGAFGLGMDMASFQRRWMERRRVQEASQGHGESGGGPVGIGESQPLRRHASDNEDMFETFVPPKQQQQQHPVEGQDGTRLRKAGVWVERQVVSGVGIHIATATDPLHTLSVYEPGNFTSCSSGNDPRSGAV